MKTILFHICIVCLFATCNTRKPVLESSPDKQAGQINIDDSTVYPVVSYLLKNTNSNPFLKYEKVLESAEMPFFFSFSTDSIEIVKLDYIFTSKDMDYMQAQKRQFYKFKLDQAKFDYKTIISKDSLELAKSYPYCYISFPVFSADKNKFIIRTGYVAGALSAEGAIFIYQKIGKDWKMIKTINQTLS
ncbi:MAG: hypothetical protein ABIO53_12425 [Chitinophagaceae bacterium]